MHLGVYVHLPFCPYICPYCDFAKWPMRARRAAEYLDALRAELARTPGVEAATIFLGGGTPNSYPAQTLSALIVDLRAQFPPAPGSLREITVDINPELVVPGDFDAYVAAGVNRLSIGVQSFVPGEIRTLGRKHTAAQVAAAVEQARAAGIGSISMDLIFGVPGQTQASWEASLDEALRLGVDHFSTYGLTVEEGTPYFRWRRAEPAAFCDSDLEADLYAAAIDRLEAAGFEHYEISNFAKPGHRARHNCNYWRNGEYLGFGVGAASYRDGVRSVHTRNLSAYISAAMNGSAIPGESERLEGARRAGEAAMLALRTEQGVDLPEFKERYGVDFLAYYAPVIEGLRAAGLLVIEGACVRLTRRGRFLANDACGAVVTFEQPAET